MTIFNSKLFVYQRVTSQHNLLTNQHLVGGFNHLQKYEFVNDWEGLSHI